MGNSVYQQLVELGPGSVRMNVELAPYSWWKIGGVADLFVEVNSQEHLYKCIEILRTNRTRFMILGQGTNVLFDDRGYSGCIIRIGRGFSNVVVDGERIQADAGCWVPRLALIAARSGLGGLEHVIGIPASLGGLICMNGGSQRKNIGTLIESVTVLTLDGAVREDSVSECNFGYRKSRYQSGHDVILGATLRFSCMRAYQDQRLEMLSILRERNSKFPRKMPSCGSVFKSSPELYDAYGPPGKIIEDLGFKGKCLGRIQVSPEHANFIVNLGGGSSRDVLKLVREIRDAVRMKTGLEMIPEFLYVDPVAGPVEVG